jgi:hypothetical protein
MTPAILRSVKARLHLSGTMRTVRINLRNSFLQGPAAHRMAYPNHVVVNIEMAQNR